MTEPLWLDGATHTELQRRGVSFDGPWGGSSALRTPTGRSALLRLHKDYVAAGAEIVTAGTFRCNLRAMARSGTDRRTAGELVRTAVRLARTSAGGAGRVVRVAASIAPVEDCYRPDLVPPDDELKAEHAWLATELGQAGIDRIFVETQNSLREARIALAAALTTGSPAWVGFVVGDDGHLLSGEPAAKAARAAERDGAAAVLINCSLPAPTEKALDRLAEVCDGPVGVRPNLEDRSAPGPEPCPPLLAPSAFGELIGRWRERFGLALIGACCGSGPAHLAVLRPGIAGGHR